MDRGYVLKFIYSEKAAKFCEIFPLLLTVCTVVKSKGKILQNFVVFSEYMNFTVFEISYLLTVLLSVSLKKLPWFIFEETVNYIRIELFAIVFGSLTKFLSLIFIMLQWNGSLYITLIVQMLTSSGFDYGLGTIHILTYVSKFLDYSDQPNPNISTTTITATG